MFGPKSMLWEGGCISSLERKKKEGKGRGERKRKRDGRKGRKKGRKERREGGLRKEGKREDVREKEKEHKVRMYGEEEGRSEFRNKKISVDNYNAMGISRAKGA